MTGPLALVGSGEFTPAMAATDAALLDAAEAAGHERAVAVLPTAAAPDGEAVVQRWFAMAREHFAALDAEVLEVDVRDRHDATELRHAADVAEVGMVYLSGGKPDHLTQVLRGTPLLDAVLERWRLDAALAGCSAGAMSIAAGWPPFLRAGGRWGEGLGVLPDVGVLPHFDRVRRWRSGTVVKLPRHAPTGWTVVGIDEDTALVHPGTPIDGPPPGVDAHGSAWRTEGVGGVWELTADGVVPLDAHRLPTPR